jgi:ADP-ribosyl-[dinitrogen reductase] hydrolase
MNRTTPDQVSRSHGAPVGLAAGDALGATNEFRPPGTFEPLSEMVSDVPST